MNTIYHYDMLPEIGFAAYRGRSIWPSWFIRKFTWDCHSHIAVWNKRLHAQGKMICEAWPSCGVAWAESFSTNHTDKTRVDFYGYARNVTITADQIETGMAYLNTQIGYEYDWAGIAKFVLRTGRPNPKKRVCSQLAAGWSRSIGHPVSNLPDHKLAPKDIIAAPILEYIGYCYTSKSGNDGSIM